MEKKKTALYWWIFILGIIIVAVFITIFIVTMKDDLNKDELIEDKVNEEISYIDTSIISILNSINNISVNNYILETQENSNDNEKKSGSSEEESSSDEAKEQSENNGNQSSSSSEGSSSGGSQDNSKESNVIYQMKRSGVLTGKEIDWDEVQNSVENLYPVWITIEVDLDKVNVNAEDISKCNQILDQILSDTKQKDKVKTVIDLGSLYKNLEVIVNQYSNDSSLINKYKTKSDIIETYVYVEEGNWQNAKSKMNDINNNFAELKKSNEEKNNKNSIQEYNLVKINKLINELSSTLDKEDKDIYYIKYKSLIEEFNLI